MQMYGRSSWIPVPSMNSVTTSTKAVPRQGKEHSFGLLSSLALNIYPKLKEEWR